MYLYIKYEYKNINTNTLAKTTQILQESSYVKKKHKLPEAAVYQMNYGHKYQQHPQTALFYFLKYFQTQNILPFMLDL